MANFLGGIQRDISVNALQATAFTTSHSVSRVSSLQIPRNASDGRVLTSDAVGNASWAPGSTVVAYTDITSETPLVLDVGAIIHDSIIRILCTDTETRTLTITGLEDVSEDTALSFRVVVMGFAASEPTSFVVSGSTSPGALNYTFICVDNASTVSHTRGYQEALFTFLPDAGVTTIDVHIVGHTVYASGIVYRRVGP